MKTISTENLSEEFEPVALENVEFENRPNNKIDKNFSHFWTIKNDNLRKKIKSYSVQVSSNAIKPSIETLMEKFKAVSFNRDWLK